MQYKEIVSVTGLGGLYQLLTTKSDGAIVRNVEDKAIKFISARQHNVTPIDSIEVYTQGENVQLKEVFMKMMEQEAEIPLVDGKKADNDTIKNYFLTVYPDLDGDRVYVSDMKKMLKWYELLKKNDLLNFNTEEESTETQDEDNETEDAATPDNTEEDTLTTETPENVPAQAEEAESKDEMAD